MRAVTSLILPEIEQLIARDDRAAIRAAVEDLLPQDLAEIVEQLPLDAAAKLMRALPLPQGSDVFAELSEARQVEIIEAIGRERFVRIMGNMSADDRANLLRRLPEETRKALLPLVAQAERNEIRKLLEYPEGTAGALLTTEYVSLPGDLHADQAVQKLREVAPDRETIYYVYVIDVERRLKGVVSLREIICAPARKTLGDIMREDPVSVHVDDDQEVVATTFRKYDLTTVPVVDRDDRLVGIITVDDVLDAIEEEHTEDVQKLGAVSPLDEPYMATSFFALIRKRAFWLVLLFLGELLTANVLHAHADVFASVGALVLFIPLIVSSGGNSGSQTATLVTRALAVGEIQPRDVLRVLSREVLAGLTLGAILGILGLIRVHVGGHPGVAPVVGLALVLIVVGGTVAGAAIPLGLKRIGLDPAVSSAPLMASLVDVLGIFAYFQVARLLLSV